MEALHFVKAQLPLAPARVLEVGCGDGRLALTLDDLGYRVTAIDPVASRGAIFQPVTLDDPRAAPASAARATLNSPTAIAALG
jgi:predicted RNA methylase